MSIIEEIEELRIKINERCTAPNIKLHEGEMLKLSEELDRLIYEYYNNKD